MPPLDLLTSWVRRQAEPEAAQWFDARLAALAAGAPERDLVIALGFVPRRLGKADLVLDEADLAAAHDARAHWDPTGWSLDQTARLALLLAARAATRPLSPSALIPCARPATWASSRMLLRPASGALNIDGEENDVTNADGS